MIKVTDLRIDNWVIAPKIGMCQVNGIQLHSDGNTYVFVVAEGMEFQHRVNLKSLKAIQLNDEILREAGFNQFADKTWNRSDMNIWRIEKTDSDSKTLENIYAWCTDVYPKLGHRVYAPFAISFLHELQTSYHVMIGKELTIVSPVVK